MHLHDDQLPKGQWKPFHHLSAAEFDPKCICEKLGKFPHYAVMVHGFNVCVPVFGVCVMKLVRSRIRTDTCQLKWLPVLMWLGLGPKLCPCRKAGALALAPQAPGADGSVVSVK